MADRTTNLTNPASAGSTATVNPIATNATASASNASNSATVPVNDTLSVAPVNFSGNSGNIVPTTDFLRSNTDIQRQVDVRFAELHNAQVATSSLGKLKSQRGGASDEPIKKFVAWPQHYLLVGKDKARPTYDQLTPMQWMSGCIKGALDLAESDRIFALKYFCNLLEDASDFSFENAKACHAVVLTTMEQDKLIPSF